MKLRKLRLEKGLTLKELASEIGVTLAYISQIEKQQKTPSLPIAFKLANFFSVSIEELFPQFKDTTKAKKPVGV